MEFWLGLGSNVADKHQKLEDARNRLRQLWANIIFSQEYLTQPIGMNNSALFLNQVAMVSTISSVEDVKQCLKSIEKAMGRTADDKKKEEINIDIDLLKCDEQIFKPNDLQRQDVVNGIEDINKIL